MHELFIWPCLLLFVIYYFHCGRHCFTLSTSYIYYRYQYCLYLVIFHVTWARPGRHIIYTTLFELFYHISHAIHQRYYIILISFHLWLIISAKACIISSHYISVLLYWCIARHHFIGGEWYKRPYIVIRLFSWSCDM